MVFSQLGSVILIIIVEPIKLFWGSYYYSILLIVILWAFAFILLTIIKENVSMEKIKKKSLN